MTNGTYEGKKIFCDTLPLSVKTIYVDRLVRQNTGDVMEIKIGANAFTVTFPSKSLLRKSLLWALGHRRGQTLHSAALELGTSWKERLHLAQ